MQLSEFQAYTNPVIRKYSSGIYVEYYCQSPLTHKLERHIQKANRVVNSAPTKRDGMKILQAYCIELSVKLKSGWRPYQLKTDTARSLTPLHQALQKFISDKKADLRPDSIRTYNTSINKLTAFTSPDMLCLDINKLFAVQYLETLNGISPRTYNANLKNCRLIFEWLKTKLYIPENPFSGIKLKKVYEKKRGIVSKDIREIITKHLREHNPMLLLYLHLIYSSLIRPKEIHSIRLQDINLQKKYIRILGTAAKNHKERLAPLTPEIVRFLIPYMQNPGNWYLFSNGLIPGPKQICTKAVYKRWRAMLKKLKLDNSGIQLYSFRDSGIFDMLKSGIDDLTVMQAADHSSLQITSIYAKHTDTQLQEKLYNEAPKF